ncbi:uncharacterized protein [Apostichopus japonicus]|uniref:uncharacterized protein isoform X2 n=1 Tax=Stichopus japonicus TaxID=307972 RepID=UPI003AB347F5
MDRRRRSYTLPQDFHLIIWALVTLEVILVTTDIFATDCLEGSDPLELSCTYNQSDGVLCEWDLTGNETYETDNLRATFTIDGMQQQQCTDLSFSEPCSFNTTSSPTREIQIALEVNGTEETLRACHEVTLLSIVKYKKPRDVLIHTLLPEESVVTVTWDLPSDYPGQGNTMRLLSFCWVRWSENFSPWTKVEIKQQSYYDIGNITSNSRYDVQVTCVCSEALKENWSCNTTYYATASIPHQSTKTPSRASLTHTTSTKMVTTMISTSTENVSTVSKQTENRRNLALPLVISFSVILLMIIGISVIIVVYHHRTVSARNVNSSRADEISGQSEDQDPSESISHAYSTEQLLYVGSNTQDRNIAKTSL